MKCSRRQVIIGFGILASTSDIVSFAEAYPQKGEMASGADREQNAASRGQRDHSNDSWIESLPILFDY